MKPARELPLRAADHGELVFDLAQPVEHAAQLLLAQLHVHRPLLVGVRVRVRLGFGFGFGFGIGFGFGLG